MAATFVVEDGTGLSTANCYVLEADADQYHENYGNPSAWSDLTSAEKQEALRIATQYLDAIYNTRWLGVRANDGQALDWPRADIYDNDGFYVASTSVPQAVQDATSFMALQSLTDDLLPSVSAGSGALEAEKVKVGPIEVESKFSGSAPQRKRYRAVEGMLRHLVRGAGVLERA